MTATTTDPAAAAADEPYVTRTDSGGVATLTLNRGARFNPLSRAMLEALDAALATIGDEPSVRAVVLEGSGRGFSAGHDLGEMRSHVGDDDWQQELFDACSVVMLRLTQIPQPVIANGKRAFWAQIDQPLAAAYETAGRAMVADLAGADAAEGIDAFLQKRRPVWRS